MDAILSYKREILDDFYHLVGCNELSSRDQIIAEYKARALELHPDKNPNDPLAEDRFKKLQLAKETLTDEVKRKKYDTWLGSGIAIPFEQWSALSTTGAQASFHWVTRKETGGAAAIEGVDSNNKREQALSNHFATWERGAADPLLKRFRNYEI